MGGSSCSRLAFDGDDQGEEAGSVSKPSRRCGFGSGAAGGRVHSPYPTIKKAASGEFDNLALFDAIMMREQGSRRKMFADGSQTIHPETKSFDRLPLLTNTRSEALYKPKPGKARRSNSTSTLFVTNTMNSPDDQRTRACLAAYVHSLIDDDLEPDAAAKLQAFEWTSKQQKTLREKYKRLEELPGESVVFAFIEPLQVQAQLSSECSIVGCVYLERAMKAAGTARLSRSVWRHLVFASLLLASKIWDDLSMINGDFSKVCPLFSKAQVNELEVQMLMLLDYDVAVDGNTYARYYFKLHEAGTDAHVFDVTLMPNSPLDKYSAQRMELITPDGEGVPSYKRMPLKRLVTDQSSVHASHPLAVLN